MAHKYDLLLVNTEKDGTKKNQPWYRERLKTKYVDPKKSKQCSGTLVGSSWTFIKKGLDDFRDGVPTTVPAEGMVLRGYKGLQPNTTSKTDIKTKTKQQKRFTKEEVVYSKSLPLQQQRRDIVNDIETSLLQHRLALFPHLEYSVPPEVFEDIVDILDPELQIASDDETEDHKISSDDMSNTLQVKHSRLGQSVSSATTDRKSVCSTGAHKNRYRWLPKVEETVKDDKSKLNRKKVETPGLDAKIQSVTKEFCRWVEDLGGETNNIEESTIMSLFASGYETKPTLSVPIHVVELTNVPPELRMPNDAPSLLTRQLNNETIEQEQDKSKYTPSWVKVKYGAWYLNPNTWKKQRPDEPLQDPKELQGNILSESKLKSQKLDGELATLHGAKAFKSFMDKKGTRKPEFLSCVEKLDDDAPRMVEREQRLMSAASSTLPSIAISTPTT